MNLTKFKYPMFTTTEYEKEILRECELWYSANPERFLGLCTVLKDNNNFNTCSLLKKIPFINVYLEGNLLGNVLSDTHAFNDRFSVRNLMRRIWITKLLNYTGE
jgi:hypothetical protein